MTSLAKRNRVETAGTSQAADTPPLYSSGQVCFLFTDIEASTVRWERTPVAMSQALRRHDEILSATLKARGGSIFKTVGDAFCCAFVRIGEALAAAAALQSAIAAEDFSAIDGLRVRVGIHVGSVENRDGDYFGPTVNRVARLLAVAHGGQILLSEASATLAEGALPAGARLKDLGTHRLKDLTFPEHVFELVVSDSQGDFPPLRSLNVLDNNLPLQTTRLVGRADDCEAILSRLREHRLVTLVGTGGVGKTRAALQVGADLVDGSGDGVWFVNLAAIRHPAFVATAVAASVGASLSAEVDVLAALLMYLEPRHLLLVVDNCEHVIDEVARVVSAILEKCSRVHVLATSREALRVRGECVYRLPSLPVPPAGAIEAADLLDYAACALFVERAANAECVLVRTPENAAAIVEICRRLDGIPLAIELAAARTRMLSPAAILQRLDERFRILTDGFREALPRQKTMRALIDWSYDLLDANERELFMRCSVFTGGWTLEAAEAVSATGFGASVLDTLGALIDKSLVVAMFDATAPAQRYTLLESIRAYAAEKLTESGASETVSATHAKWVSAMLEAALQNELIPEWLARVSPEADNIVAALVWCLGHGDDPLLACRIVTNANHLWYEGGLAGPGRRFIEAVLARTPNCEPAVASRLWQLLATLRFANGAIDAAERALIIAEGAGDKAEIIGSLRPLGFALWQAGRSAEAQVRLERAIAMHRELGTERSIGFASAHDALGNVLCSVGNTAEARSHFSEAEQIFTSLGDRLGAANVRGNFAELEFTGGDAVAALKLVGDAIVVFREMRATIRLATALVNRAAYLVSLHEGEEARTCALEALALGRRAHDPQIVSVAIQHLAAVAAYCGESERAARLLGYVDSWYRNEGYEREHNERSSRNAVATVLNANLAPDAVMLAMAAGECFSEDEAAAEAELLCAGVGARGSA